MFSLKVSFFILIASFLGSCTSSSPKVKDSSEVQLVDLFDQSLRDSKPQVEYLLKSDEDNNSMVAIFVTNSEKYYQLISLIYKRESKCSTDTKLDGVENSESFFGPSGATFSFKFCASGFEMKLVDSNLLSAKEKSHGIKLNDLAAKIQVLMKK